MKNKIFKIFTTIDEENLAYHLMDDSIIIDKRRESLAMKYNYNKSKLKYMEQIHSNIIEIVTEEINLYKCDGLITNLPNTPLLVVVADCIPILFWDTIKNVIGVVHAGRNGTYQAISSNMVKLMINKFHCHPSDIQVTMGPSIQYCCYEVSEELAEITKNNFGKDVVNGRFVNLQLINEKQLLKCEIPQKNITISKVCTKCSNKNYFSYRKDPKCGRFSGIIMLRND